MHVVFTYQRVTARRQDGLVTWRAVLHLGWAVGRGLAAEPELLTGGVQLQVVDGRSGADSHHAKGRVGVGGGLGSRSRGGQ